MKPVQRIAVWTLVGVVLVAVFAAYLRPDLAFTLASQLWACF
jgi:hypothetical protein